MRAKRTLAESIDRMARETGASAVFVERIRAMFVEKGIALDADAAPFEAGLGDAFAREAAVHEALELARRRLGTLRDRLPYVRKPASSLFRLVPGDHDRFLVPGPDGLH